MWDTWAGSMKNVKMQTDVKKKITILSYIVFRLLFDGVLADS